MSCMVLSTDALATIAEGLETILNCGYDLAGIEAPETLREVLKNRGCMDRYGYAGAKKIYEALHDLNMAAYCTRYKGQTPEPCPAYPGKIRHMMTRAEWDGRRVLNSKHYHYISLVDCLLYNCAEGDARKTDLYKGLADLQRVLYAWAVRNTAEYAAAPWGSV